MVGHDLGGAVLGWRVRPGRAVLVRIVTWFAWG